MPVNVKTSFLYKWAVWRDVHIIYISAYPDVTPEPSPDNTTELRRIEDCVAVLLVQQGNIEFYFEKLKQGEKIHKLLIKGTILDKMSVQHRMISKNDGK